MTKNKLPKKLIICGNTYRIKYYKNEINVAKDGDADDLYGEVRHHDGEIRVFSDRPREQIWRTLWHEAIHSAIFHMKSSEYIKKGAQEPLTDELALALQGLEWE